VFGYNRVLTKSAPNPYATPYVARTEQFMSRCWSIRWAD